MSGQDRPALGLRPALTDKNMKAVTTVSLRKGRGSFSRFSRSVEIFFSFPVAGMLFDFRDLALSLSNSAKRTTGWDRNWNGNNNGRGPREARRGG